VNGGVYLIQDSGQLVEMREEAYASEDLLQRLLADYPNLLAGDQISSDDPRRWVLVAREASVAAEDDGPGRWSVDHLFLDQDAIPTIVEVKRSTDTRIRREVVGQMLDYAANGVSYWSIDALRAQFTQSREDPEQVLADLLDAPSADPEEFWQKAKTNLQAGRVRLVFVADEIPSELRRIVEFLNQQMDPAEVLAVEIKQYVGGSLKTLVPRLVGQTVEAQQKKSGAARTGGRWDEISFFQELEVQAPEAVKPARAIFDWATKKASRITWGKGKKYGTFSPVLSHNAVEHRPIQVWTGDYLYVQFGDMRPPFSDEHARKEFLRRLNEIPDVTIPDSALDKYPSIALTTLNNEGALERFLAVLDWVAQEIRAA
jgi:hypothetical protein